MIDSTAATFTPRPGRDPQQPLSTVAGFSGRSNYLEFRSLTCVAHVIYGVFVA